MMLAFCTAAVLVVISCLVAYYLFSLRRFKYWKERGVPYVEPSFPFGNFSAMFTFKKAMGIILKEIHLQSNTPYVGMYVFNKPWLLIRDSEVMKSVLIKDFNYFPQRTVDVDRKIDNLTAQMLFFIQNPEWTFMRRKLTPAYSSSKLKTMYELFEEIGNDLIEHLSKSIRVTSVVNVKDLLIRFNTDLITSAVFGIRTNSFEQKNSEFKDIAEGFLDVKDFVRAFSMLSYLIAPFFVKLFRLKWIDTKAVKFLKDVFWETVKKRKEKNISRNDLLQLLMQIQAKEFIDGEYSFDDDSLLAQAVTFFQAGADTSGSTATFALYVLAKNKEVQDKVRKELKEAVETHGRITFDVLTKDLKYLDMVVKETLRLYPVIPFVNRKCCQDYVLPGTSHVIEKGTGVFVSLLGIQMDPENFPDPEKFIPERFSPERINEIKSFSYMPFGEGPRNCIGMRFGVLSVKCALATIIANFEIDLCENFTSVDFHANGFMLMPHDGYLPIKFRQI